MFSQVYDFLRDIEGLPTTIRVNYVKMEKTKANTKDVQCELTLVMFSVNSKSSDYTRHTD
jgi:hypothetical protein